MGLWTPKGITEYQKLFSQVTAPGILLGPSLVSDDDVTWTSLLTSSDVSFDVYAISFYFNASSSAADPRASFDDLGVDPAGGTSYTPLISNLIAGGCGTDQQGPGHSYHFPIFIKAGSSLAMRVTSSSGSAHEVWTQLWGKPKNPQETWAGTECIDISPGLPFGVPTGGAITLTAGTTSEGAWTALGTLSKDCHYWQAAMAIDDTTMTSGNIYFLDIAYGDATTKNIIIQDMIYTVSSANETLATNGYNNGCYRTVKAGSIMYARVQCSGTADSNIYAGVWGIR